MSFSLGFPEQQTANISGLYLGGSPSLHIICIGNAQVWFVQWPNPGVFGPGKPGRMCLSIKRPPKAIFSEAGRPM